jgi:hypothetical protein
MPDASRAHVVLKPPAGITSANADIADCELRVTGDYRQVNLQIQKLVPNLPTGAHQLERAAGHRYYFESDSVACHNSFVLAPGRSREALAIWTPIGLVQPTVLPFGQKNSGAEAQGPYRDASRALQNLSNYVDDWLGFSNDIDAFCDDFENFLAVCVENRVALNTNKTRVGDILPHNFLGSSSTRKVCVSPTSTSTLFKTWSLLLTSRNSAEFWDSLSSHAASSRTTPCWPNR